MSFLTREFHTSLFVQVEEGTKIFGSSAETEIKEVPINE